MFWEVFTLSGLVSNVAAAGALSLLLVLGVVTAARAIQL